MSIPATYNITLTQGDSFELPVTMSDNQETPVAIDLSATTITSDIKKNYKTTTPLTSFTVTKTNAASGEFTLSLTKEQTLALPVTRDDESNILYYDVEFAYSSTNHKTEFGGTLTVLKQVTI